MSTPTRLGKVLPDPGRLAIEAKSRLGLDNRPAIRALDQRWALGGVGINPNDPGAGAPPPPRYKPWSAATQKYRSRMDSSTAAIVDRGKSPVPAIHDPKLQAYEIQRERMINAWSAPRKFSTDNMTDLLTVASPAEVLGVDDADERASDQQFGQILGQHAAHLVARVHALEEERTLRHQREHPGESVMSLERSDQLSGRNTFAAKRQRWQSSQYR